MLLRLNTRRDFRGRPGPRGLCQRTVDALASGSARWLCLVWLTITPSTLSAAILGQWDFENVTLGPNVDEVVPGEVVWTDDPPAGWTVDDRGVPGHEELSTDGVTEWAGWAFANKDWWVLAAGDQTRGLFQRGSGTVAVADPDEWDDLAHPVGLYNAWMFTPSIALAGVAPNTIVLRFDSSWRPECCDSRFGLANNQTALITASFDGGSSIEVLQWSSDPMGPNFHDEAQDELVTVSIPNPLGATSMRLGFGLLLAENDWWWAIDNIVVSAPLPPTITSQPESATAREGSSVSIAITATGDGPLSYQWYRGSGPMRTLIEGADSATLTIPSVQLSDAGIYSVRVSNPVGFVDGSPIALSVRPPPLVFQGVENEALGDATVEGGLGGLIVANLGSTGTDGVSIDLGERSRRASLQLDPVDLSGTLGATLRFEPHGMLDDVPNLALGAVELRNNSVNVELAWPDDWEMPWLVSKGATVVGSGRFAAGEAPWTLSGPVQLAGVTIGDASPEADTRTFWDLEFASPVVFTPPTGPSLTGTRLRVMHDSPNPVLRNLARLEITGSNLDSIQIADLDTPLLQPSLRLTTAGQELDLNWDSSSAVLQSASSPGGPWTEFVQGTNATSVPLQQSNEFFRVQMVQFDPCRFDHQTPLTGYACRRNVLLVIADDVGIDQLARYVNYYNSNSRADDDISVDTGFSNPAASTPTLERLAAAGVTFLNAWSSPTGRPTRAGLYTGLHSVRHGVYSSTPGGLPARASTLPAVLGTAGYVNGLFGKWHLGTNTSQLPTLSGWNKFEGALHGELENYYVWSKVSSWLGSTGVFRTTSTASNYATLETINDALPWIWSQSNAWMATLSFNAPHWAGTAASPFYQDPPSGCAILVRTNHDNSAKYRAKLECLDRSLGSLLDALGSNALQQTTILFLGDNGTEADITDHFDADKCKGSLYEGGINVPLIVADGYFLVHGQQSPWSVDRGRIVSPGRYETNLVQTLDVFATVAALGRTYESAGSDSVSLLPYLRSTSALAQRSHLLAESRSAAWAVCGTNGWNLAVRDLTHKLHVTDYAHASTSYQLYDLASDRWEATDLLADGASPGEQAIVEALRAAAAALLGSDACP